ncbi:unnamed protein product [Lota lota]
MPQLCHTSFEARSSPGPLPWVTSGQVARLRKNPLGRWLLVMVVEVVVMGDEVLEPDSGSPRRRTSAGPAKVSCGSRVNTFNIHARGSPQATGHFVTRTDESSEDSFIAFGPKISHVEELEEADD